MQYFPIFSFILLLIISHYSVTTHGNTTTRISLLVEVLDDWKNYLDFQNLHPFCPAERFKVSLFAEMAPDDRREGKSIDQSRDIYLIENIPLEWMHKSVAAHKGKQVVQDDVILTVEMAKNHGNVNKLLLRNILKSSSEKLQHIQVSILHEIKKLPLPPYFNQHEKEQQQYQQHDTPQFHQETQQQYFHREQETPQQPQEQENDENSQQQLPMQAQGGHVEEHFPRSLAINKEEAILLLQELRKKSKNRCTKSQDKTHKKTYKSIKYSEEYARQFPGISASRHGPTDFYCAICKKDYALGKSSTNINAHLKTKKHNEGALKISKEPGKMQEILERIEAGKGYYDYDQVEEEEQQQQMEDGGLQDKTENKKRKRAYEYLHKYMKKYDQEFGGMFTVSSTLGDSFAHCLPCEVDLAMTPGRGALIGHLKSKTHQEIVDMLKVLASAGGASSSADSDEKWKEGLLMLQSSQQQGEDFSRKQPKNAGEHADAPIDLEYAENDKQSTPDNDDDELTRLIMDELNKDESEARNDEDGQFQTQRQQYAHLGQEHLQGQEVQQQEWQAAQHEQLEHDHSHQQQQQQQITVYNGIDPFITDEELMHWSKFLEENPDINLDE